MRAMMPAGGELVEANPGLALHHMHDPVQDRLTAYLSRTTPYDDLRLTVFSHGDDSIGLPDIGEWQAVLGHARRCGQLIAVDPDHYPRHFRALTGFHRELSRLPRLPELPSLDWHDARQYLAARAAAHGMSFGPEGLPR